MMVRALFFDGRSLQGRKNRRAREKARMALSEGFPTMRFEEKSCFPFFARAAYL
jgi:hypothetical protein